MKTILIACLGCLALSGCFVETSDRDRGYSGDRYSDEYDPVCGTEVDVRSPWRDHYGGRTYYFHDEACRNRFHHRPGAYVDRSVRDRRGVR